MAQSQLEELDERFHEVDFGVSMCALTILRYTKLGREGWSKQSCGPGNF